VIAPQCFNHPARESVARCPECRRCYCRECITEHEGRVICAPCLARLVRPTAGRARRHLKWVTAPLAVATGLLSAWLVFYTLGWALARIPSEFHEGAWWRQLPAEK
jgi:hypothetical protein